MKKNLKVTGKVLFERHDFVKMITEVLQHTEDLQVERIIPIDKNGNPVELESLICYVHQIKSEEIPDKYDPPKTINAKSGVSRPNYGIGKMLKEMFSEDKVYHFDELFKELHYVYNRLTKQALRMYLRRPEMVGAELEVNGDEYWNPKAQLKRVSKHETNIVNEK